LAAPEGTDNHFHDKVDKQLREATRAGSRVENEVNCAFAEKEFCEGFAGSRPRECLSPARTNCPVDGRIDLRIGVSADRITGSGRLPWMVIMPHSSNQTYRIAAVFFGLTAFLIGVPPAPAQEAQPAPNVADLERRVRELEEIIKQMQAARQPAPGPVSPEPAGASPTSSTGSIIVQQPAEAQPTTSNPSTESNPSGGERGESSGSCDGSESRAKNITDELGLRSRGV
jgi:hypothetical protein